MKDITFFIDNAKDSGKITSAILELLSNGLKLDVVIKQHKNKRTKAQNDFYWENCTDLALFLNNSVNTEDSELRPYLQRGIFNDCYFTKEIIHSFNKNIFGIESTTTLSIKEFCEFMDMFFCYWQEKTRYYWTPKESVKGYLERTGLV